MKKEAFLVVVIALAAGILIGVIVTNAKKETSAPQSSAAKSVPPPPIVDHLQQTSVLEGIVAKEPNNRNAWIKLGHVLFDSNQPLKAIDAYEKALELNGNDPNLLTDQGIMYRRVGWYDKAISNFKKAHSLDSNHQQSLYNMGIIYRDDLKDYAKVTEVWQRFIALNPDSPAAAQVRAELEHMSKTMFPQSLQ